MHTLTATVVKYTLSGYMSASATPTTAPPNVPIILGGIRRSDSPVEPTTMPNADQNSQFGCSEPNRTATLIASAVATTAWMPNAVVGCSFMPMKVTSGGVGRAFDLGLPPSSAALSCGAAAAP